MPAMIAAALPLLALAQGAFGLTYEMLNTNVKSVQYGPNVAIPNFPSKRSVDGRSIMALDTYLYCDPGNDCTFSNGLYQTYREVQRANVGYEIYCDANTTCTFDGSAFNQNQKRGVSLTLPSLALPNPFSTLGATTTAASSSTTLSTSASTTLSTSTSSSSSTLSTSTSSSSTSTSAASTSAAVSTTASSSTSAGSAAPTSNYLPVAPRVYEVYCDVGSTCYYDGSAYNGNTLAVAGSIYELFCGVGATCFFKGKAADNYVQMNTLEDIPANYNGAAFEYFCGAGSTCYFKANIDNGILTSL